MRRLFIEAADAPGSSQPVNLTRLLKLAASTKNSA
jgi:hypothetical protein